MDDWLVIQAKKVMECVHNQLYLSVSEKRAIISNNFVVVAVVQSLSHVRLLATPWTAALQASLSFTISQSLLTSCPLKLGCHPTISSVLSPSPPALNFSQHQGLFQWVSSSHQVNKLLEFQLRHQSFQWPFRIDFLYDRLVGSPSSPRDSQEFSNTTVQKHQFFGTQLSL